MTSFMFVLARNPPVFFLHLNKSSFYLVAFYLSYSSKNSKEEIKILSDQFA